MRAIQSTCYKNRQALARELVDHHQQRSRKNPEYFLSLDLDLRIKYGAFESGYPLPRLGRVTACPWFPGRRSIGLGAGARCLILGHVRPDVALGAVGWRYRATRDPGRTAGLPLLWADTRTILFVFSTGCRRSSIEVQG